MMFLSGVSRELDGIVEYNPNRQHDACCTEDQLAGTTVAGHGFSLQPSGTTLQQYIQKPSSERIHQIWGGPAQTVEESPVRACIWRIMKSTICLSAGAPGHFQTCFYSDQICSTWWGTGELVTTLPVFHQHEFMCYSFAFLLAVGPVMTVDHLNYTADKGFCQFPSQIPWARHSAVWVVFPSTVWII